MSRNESKDGFALTAGLRPQWCPQMEDGGEESRDEVAMDKAQGAGMHVGREREELPEVGSAKSLTWEWAWQQRESLCGRAYECWASLAFC